MVNSLTDGLSEPNSLGSPATLYISGNSTQKSVNGQALDFGTITSSGNTSVVLFAKTFSAAPKIFCFPAVGSVAEANLSVLSNIGTGSFSVATGSNIANVWFAIGSGNY